MKVTRKTFLGVAAAAAAAGWRLFAFAAPARKQRGYNDTTWWDPYVESIRDKCACHKRNPRKNKFKYTKYFIALF